MPRGLTNRVTTATPLLGRGPGQHGVPRNANSKGKHDREHRPCHAQLHNGTNVWPTGYAGLLSPRSTERLPSFPTTAPPAKYVAGGWGSRATRRNANRTCCCCLELKEGDLRPCLRVSIACWAGNFQDTCSKSCPVHGGQICVVGNSPVDAPVEQ